MGLKCGQGQCPFSKYQFFFYFRNALSRAMPFFCFSRSTILLLQLQASVSCVVCPHNDPMKLCNDLFLESVESAITPLLSNLARDCIYLKEMYLLYLFERKYLFAFSQINRRDSRCCARMIFQRTPPVARENRTWRTRGAVLATRQQKNSKQLRRRCRKMIFYATCLAKWDCLYRVF